MPLIHCCAPAQILALHSPLFAELFAMTEVCVFQFSQPAACEAAGLVSTEAP